MNRNAFLWMTGLMPFNVGDNPPPPAPPAPTGGYRTMKPVQPGGDEKFATDLQNIITVANANLTTLGLTAADITPLVTVEADLNSKIADWVAKRAAAFASTVARHTSRKTANGALRVFQNKVKSNPTVPAALLAQLGIKTRSGKPAPLTPQIPTDLVVTPEMSGTNLLRWKPNGNTHGVTYVIQAKTGAETDFSPVSTTTRREFKHTGQTIGQKVTYRVSARRNGQDTAPSNEATVYGTLTPVQQPQTVTLKLAA